MVDSCWYLRPRGRLLLDYQSISVIGGCLTYILVGWWSTLGHSGGAYRLHVDQVTINTLTDASVNMTIEAPYKMHNPPLICCFLNVNLKGTTFAYHCCTVVYVTSVACSSRIRPKLVHNSCYSRLPEAMIVYDFKRCFKILRHMCCT